ncbi:MAG: class I SAM-dependent methyltransferase [Proteobacteria bacterium]|nr:class I SAM-dependent methyltransferase [Pseudomonadota bacterium]
MDINELKQVNDLWINIYPYLVSQLMESYLKNSGEVLELGPFSGGISVELLKLYPEFNITIADNSKEVLKYLKQEISISGCCHKINFKQTEFNHLDFDDAQFDLVILRGAFFFLNEKNNFLGEIFRILKPGGMAFVGGGFGKDTPQKIIDEIADESRRLNDNLGRRRISIKELEKIVKDSELTSKCKIAEQGGIWLIIKK